MRFQCLKQPRITETERADIEATLAWIEDHDSAEAARLRLVVEERQSRWDTLLEIRPPFQNLGKYLKADQSRIDGEMLIIAAAGTQGRLLQFTRPPPLEVSATFQIPEQGTQVLGFKVLLFAFHARDDGWRCIGSRRSGAGKRRVGWHQQLAGGKRRGERFPTVERGRLDSPDPSAISDRRLKLASYPVCAISGEPLHDELMLRMQIDDKSDWLPAGQILPMATRVRLTGELDLAAFDLAIATAREIGAGAAFAINLSAESVENEAFRASLLPRLQSIPEGSRFWIEIPENGLLRHFAAVRALRDSERVAGRWSQIRTVATGFAVMFAAVALNLAVSGLLPAGVPQSVLPIGLFGCGMSIAMPAMSLLALELFPARRGMASSCQSFLQIGLNAVTAGMTAPLLWGSTFSLASGMALFAMAGLCAWLLWLRLPAARR